MYEVGSDCVLVLLVHSYFDDIQVLDVGIVITPMLLSGLVTNI